MEMYGWDLVSALSVATVNTILRDEPLTKAAFDFEYLPAPAVALAIKGNFAGWAFVKGGSGKLLHLEVTLGESTFSITNNGAVTAGPASLAGTVVKLEVPLGFVTAADAATQELRFNFTTTGAVSSDQAVKLLATTLPAGLTVDKDRIGQAVLQCIANNPASSSHVFASLLLNAGSPPDQGAPSDITDYSASISNILAGLIPMGSHVAQVANTPLGQQFLQHGKKPLVVGYDFQYNEAVGENSEGYFTVLNALYLPNYRDDGTYPEPQQPQEAKTDSALYADNAPICLGMSVPYLLTYIILPQMPAAYHVPDEGAFELRNSTIVNTRAIDLPGVDVNIGIKTETYHPTIDEVHITVESDKGGVLRTTLYGSCDVSSGISMTFTYIMDASPTPTPDATSIVFTSQPASLEYWTHESTLAKIGNVLSGDLVNVVCGAICDSIRNGIGTSLQAYGLTQFDPNLVRWTDFHLNYISGQPALTPALRLAGSQDEPTLHHPLRPRNTGPAHH